MKRLFTVLLVVFTLSVSAQDVALARKILDTLSSAELWGRGYTKGGMGKAADYLSAEFKSLGLVPLAPDYKQHFSYPVNTFPGKMELAVNGVSLVPGKDFIVDPSSPGITVTTELEQLDSITFISRTDRLAVIVQDKLTWGSSQKLENYTVIVVNRKAVTIPRSAAVRIENVFIPEFKTSNLCGMVKGTVHPDSVVMFTAHYDHLGGMGSDTYFPGANDNASGIALLLSLAKYYTLHPQRYSVVFVAFAGEEAGLVGSGYFTEHPLVKLDRIRFLVNVDIVGTGDKGITVVNATLYPKEFGLLKSLNEESGYFSAVNSRGPAANSDHHSFTKKGVPAFFIYTEGGVSAYHDIYDVPATLPLTKFKELYKLFIAFNFKLMR